MSPARTGITVSLKVAVLVNCWGCSDTSNKDTADPLRLLGSYRPIEARLTLDTGYVACGDSSASAADAKESALCVDKLAPETCSPRPRLRTSAFDQLRALTERLTAASAEMPNARLQAFLLWQADPSRTEAEISGLEHALESRIGDSDTHSDLSAAYFHLAMLTGRPGLLFNAYEFAAKALQLDPGHRQALFNSALVLTRLHLPTPARLAWDAYLRRDSEGPWADEARRRRDALADLEPGEESPALAEVMTDHDTAGLVARNPQRAREWAELDLAETWAQAHLARDPAADRHLRTSRSIAAKIAEVSGDQMFEEGVQAIERALRSGTSKADDLARGHRDLAQGYNRLYDDWNLDEAASDFDAARRSFARADSPYVQWAAFYQALLLYYKNRFLQSRSELQRLRAEISQERHPVLYGRASWILGLDNANLQDYETAAEDYGHAVETFCRAGELQNLAVTQGLLASALSELGRRDETWALTRSALGYFHAVYEPLRRQAILHDATYNAQRQGKDLVALAFVDEFLVSAYASDEPQIIHNAHMRRASLLHSLRRVDESRAEFALAVQALEKLHGPEIALRAVADHTLETGRTLVEVDPAKAIGELTSSIEANLRMGSFLKLPAVYRLRGEAFLRRAGQSEPQDTADLGNAERDFAEQLYLLDMAHRGVILEEVRNLFVRETAEAYDNMIAFQAGVRRRPEQAFRYAELARSALFETWARQAGMTGLDRSRESSDVPPVEAFQLLLAEDEAALEYVVLKDRVLILVLTRDDFLMTEAAIGDHELRQLIKELMTATLSEQDAYRAPSQRLYDVLIGPAERLVDPKPHITVVADKVLNELPFDLLVNPRNGRFLIEDHTVTAVPSMILFRRLLIRARDLEQADQGRVVAVAGAVGPRPRLPELRSAKLEALSIAEIYGGEMLAGDATSPEGLLALLEDASIFHFAGHVEPDDRPPYLPRLILVDQEQQPSVLTAANLQDQPFSKLSLVVLSGCRSARTVDGSGALLGIARPFLAAGVPTVIGSHWDVDDRATAKLFIAFHRVLSSGADVGLALRQAKLDLLQGDDLRHRHPAHWAGFSLIGVGRHRLVFH